ncbi:XIRP1 protein, partial [Pardalotus punctatus]|nr:XIRP1 protein [Pardalotus punctatus]
ALLQTPLPTLPPLSCKPSDQSPAEKPRTPPKPETTAPPRKKPVPPPKPEHLLHEAYFASANNSTSRSTKPIPPPLPPKPSGLRDISKPKPIPTELGLSCMEVHEQSGYEEVQSKCCTLESSAKKSVTVQGGINPERKLPKYTAKTPLQIAEERYKANKGGQGKVESDSAKTSKPVKNGVVGFEVKQEMMSDKAAAPRRCPGEVAQRQIELCREENGCPSLSPPTCPGRAQTQNVPGQTEPSTSSVGHTTPPKGGDDTAQNASSKVERESVSNSYGSWDSQRVIQQVHERRQMSHSMTFHQQSMNSFEEHQQGNSRQLKHPDREAETPAQEKPAVVMREKKKRETEDERRKRLSVHKEEIMKGNVKEAMEIFENLRRQEQLQEILTRVREFEEETSKVDVKALKSFFEKVPEWVVHQKAKQQDKAQAKEDTDSVSSVDLVFEDLERASAEILHLKEQTLARIQDIEEAIKKAIYSVSSLKSESDIAGLSGLFKESLGSTQSSVSSSNIRKISIVSSKAKQEEVTLETGEAASVEGAKVAEKTEAAKAELEVPRLIQSRVSSPSSPSYISIESAARKPAESPRTAHSPQDVASPDCLDSPGKRDAFAQNSFSSFNHPSAGHDAKPLEKRPEPVQTKPGLGSMKQHTLGNANHPTSDKEKCSPDTSKDSCHCGMKGSFSEYRSLNAPSPQNPRRQKSILELQTGPDGSKLYGATRTVMEQYEEMDQFGNKIITSSTTVTKQSETQTSSTCDVVSHPQYEVSASPMFRRYLKSPGEDFHTNGTFQEPGVVFVTFGNSKPKK